MAGSPIEWLEWSRRLAALAANGLEFAANQFETDRYEKVRAIALEIMSTHTGRDPEVLLKWLTVQPGYATPKVDVRSACFVDGKILMVQEKSDGGWCLPGGWADVGERPAESAERETFEESGFSCIARKLVGVYDANRSGEPLSAFHAYKLVFQCEITGGEPSPDHEILSVGFFGRDGIPPLSSNRTPPATLVECFAHFDDPGRPTHFD
jgi:ADP-ribose pyrophosphatase YjhB (NUDIX family)